MKRLVHPKHDGGAQDLGEKHQGLLLVDWSTFSREGSTLAEPDDIPSSDHPVVQNTLFEILLRLKADMTKNPEILESFRLS